MTTLHDAARQAQEEHANRYQVVRDGYWWRVKIGNGTQTVGQYHTEAGALRLASDLNRAFHDGGFVVQEALRTALAQQDCVYTIKHQDGFVTQWRTGCAHETHISAPEEVGFSLAPMPNAYGKYCRFCGKVIVVGGKT
jgi:hypothetical protein